MTTPVPPDGAAEKPRWKDPGKPTGGMKSWVDWLLVIVFVLAVAAGLIAVIAVLIVGDDHTAASGQTRNGVYIPAGNQIRFTENDDAQDASLSVETNDTCASLDLVTVGVYGFTPGGEYAVRIKSGVDLDSGWTGIVNQAGSIDTVKLNCRVFPIGRYTVEITDLTTRKAATVSFVSERRRL